MSTDSVSLGGRLRHEVFEFIPVALYFLVAFQLLALTQALMLQERGIHISSSLAAAVGALIVAKVILIADHFSFVNRFPHRPLIYNTLWKTAIYFAGSIVVRYGEQLFHFMRHSGSFAAANRALLEELNWAHLVCVHLWLLVFLVLYCAVNELARTLGAGRVFELFFAKEQRQCPSTA